MSRQRSSRIRAAEERKQLKREVSSYFALDRLALFCRRKFGRNVRVTWRGGEKILREIGFGLAERPADAACEEINKEGILPIFRTVTHGGKEHAAFAVHACPGDGVRAALVALILEHAGVDRCDDVNVGREIFQ